MPPPVKRAKYLRVSIDGQNLIKWFEKLRLTSYRDIGVWSIGYGSRSPVDYPYTITRVKAEQMFRTDIAQLEKWLNAIILRENTKQHQFDAIASWTYNIGHGAAFSSTLMKKYNMGADENSVAKEFNTWVYVTDPRRKIKIMSRGLAYRRKVESSMFMEGKLVYF